MAGDMVTIVCWRGADPTLLDADVGGRRVRDLISDRLVEVIGSAAHVAVRPESSPAVPYYQGDVVSATSLRELCADEEDILIVDGRAWFAAGTSQDTWSSLATDRGACRVVGASHDLAPFSLDTLAVYLHGDDLNARGGDLLSKPLWEACEQILDGVALVSRGAPEVPCRGLLLDGYDALSQLEAFVLRDRAAAAMRGGVRMRDPDRVYIRGSLACGIGVIIDTDVIFDGDVLLGDHVKVDAHCVVSSSRIASNTWIKAFSLVEGATVGSGSMIGPYGRIRPGSVIGDNCQIGNYVEVKNSVIGTASRINHHSFIGDAVLEEHVTIGAGTITCNHDGTTTNQTFIGSGAYVGSGCNLVAPLRIGEKATIGAGSTITDDVPPATLTLARSRQETIPNWRGPRSAHKQK